MTDRNPERVRLDRSGYVAVLTIDRPEKHNAINIEMARTIGRLANQVNDDDGIRVIVITGGGGKAFCAGSDVMDLAQSEFQAPWKLRNRAAAGNDYPGSILAIRKPTIAAIAGHCIGGGLEIAIACDIRIATRSARFAAREIKLGWHGGSGMTQLLPRVMSYGKATQMLLTGDPIDAQTAFETGLVQELVDDEQLLPMALSIAEAIAGNAPIAVQLTKHITRMTHSMPLHAGLAYENDLAVWLWSMPDAKEGIAAFQEKRAAEFSGEI